MRCHLEAVHEKAACSKEVSTCWPRPLSSRAYSPALIAVVAMNAVDMLSHGV
jgi:hypothetical protein